MKKRLLCLVLLVFMIVPFVLSSCDQELTDQELMEQIRNAQDGKIALTLSVWVPTNSDVNDEAFKANLASVEAEINKSLESAHLLRIELTAISADEYDEKLAQKLEQIKQETRLDGDTDPNKKPLPSIIADEYDNVVEMNDSGRPEIIFPEVLSNQIDIFYISGKDSYTEIANGDFLHSLSSYLNETGTYNDINKMIVSQVLSQYQVGGKTYALPNNHAYITSDNNYLLINKELYSKYCGENEDITELKDLLQCEDFIKLVGESAEENEVPFVGSIVTDIYELPELGGFDFDLVAGTSSDAKPSSILALEEFTGYISLYKKLTEGNLVKSELAEGEKAAVMLLSANIDELAKYSNDYEIIRTSAPLMEEEPIFESMFAISKYSANYEKALHLLYLLQTDTELITALQYGIEGETYSLETNEDGEEIINLFKDKETGAPVYDMTGLYLGNGYRTYKGDGESVEAWENVKFLLNYGIVEDPYANLLDNFNNGEQVDKAVLNNLHSKLEGISQEVLTAIDAMSAEEFDLFVLLYNTSLAELNAQIEALEGKEELTEEETEEYNTLLSLKEAYNGNELIQKLHSDDFVKLVDHYVKLYNSYK